MPQVRGALLQLLDGEPLPPGHPQQQVAGQAGAGGSAAGGSQAGALGRMAAFLQELCTSEGEVR